MRDVSKWCLGCVLAGALVVTSGCGDGASKETVCLTGEARAAPDAFCGEVDSYAYGFDLDTRVASVAVTLEPSDADAPCAVLRTREVPRDVTWNTDLARDVRLDGGRIRACGEVAQSVTLGARIDVPTTPIHGIGFTEPIDRFGHRFAYMLGFIGECDRFGPCDAKTDRLAHFRFEVTHDPATTVLCPGVRTTSSGRTTCEIEGTRAPTYSAYGILASDALVMTPWTTANGVRVERYEVPEGGLGDALDGETIADFIAFATALFGPLPYGETLRVIGAPVPWLGFEHPANIVMSDTVMTVPNLYAHPTRHVLLHEIVHQWAGNRTTLADAYDFVWKEAIAEYVAYVYEDIHFPADSAMTRRGWDRLARFAYVYPRPTDVPPPRFENVMYDAYGTGPMLLVALEDLVGRAAVLDGIRRFLSKPGAQPTHALFDDIASASGTDLSRFVETFVFGAGEPDWPVFTTEAQVDEGLVTVTATQTVRAGPPRPVVLAVRVVGATSSVDVVLTNGLSPTTFTMRATAPFGEPVIDVEIDVAHRTIDSPDLDTLAHAEPAPPRVRHHP